MPCILYYLDYFVSAKSKFEQQVRILHRVVLEIAWPSPSYVLLGSERSMKRLLTFDKFFLIINELISMQSIQMKIILNYAI